MRIAGWIFTWLAACICAIWSVGALAFDFSAHSILAATGLAFALLLAVICFRGNGRKLAAMFGGFVLVLPWWLTLVPSNDRLWQPDVAQTAWAQIDGETVTLHNVRNCQYRTETDYKARWETRTVRLSELTGIDLAINYWGSPWMAHPIASFQFKDSPPVAISIETRKEFGEGYSALRGFFRQFELIYVVADERDLIGVRTNQRQGEDVYLYRTTATPEQARERFLEYLRRINELHVKPAWYHAATQNCTTAIRTQRDAQQRSQWDWRMLVNGKGDELMFERGMLATAGLPFAELKKRALCNAAAQAVDQAADFSTLIRAGRPGF